MSRLGSKAERAQAGVLQLESALERTEKALEAAQRVDEKVASARKGSRKLFKLVLLLTLVGVSVLVVRKLMTSDTPPPSAGTPAGGPRPASGNGSSQAADAET